MRLKSGKKFSKNENSSCGGLDVKTYKTSIGLQQLIEASPR